MSGDHDAQRARVAVRREARVASHSRLPASQTTSRTCAGSPHTTASERSVSRVEHMVGTARRTPNASGREVADCNSIMSCVCVLVNVEYTKPVLLYPP